MYLESIRKNILYLLVAPLLLTALLTSFLLHNGISIFAPEALMTYLLLIAAGLLPGLIMVFGGIKIRMLTAALFIVLLIASQIKAFPLLPELPYGLRYRHIALMLGLVLSVVFYCWRQHFNRLFILMLGISSIVALFFSGVPFMVAMSLLILGISIICYFLRQHLDKILLIIFGTYWIGAFFTPTVPLIVKNPVSIENKETDHSLPPYIHIVLDEHIGIEGIPPDIDPNHEFANALKNKYIQNGFKVYGRAFSRYVWSRDSFSSFLNFNPIARPAEHYQKGNITKNIIFETLSQRGYQLNIMQSSYMNLCHEYGNFVINSCITYKKTHPEPIDPSSISLKDRVLNIFHHYAISLPFGPKVKSIYETFRASPFGKAAGLQNRVVIMDAPYSTYKAHDELTEFLRSAKKGNAYFVHLLLPHRPYLFDKQCRFRGSKGSYSIAGIKESFYKYPQYLEQVKCGQLLVENLLHIITNNPATKDSTIVIHSDHGSRLQKKTSILKEQFADFTGEDFIQSFSTFFVVRGPEHQAGYDRRPLPLDYLLKNIVLDKIPPPKDESLRLVYLLDGQPGYLKPFSIPPFSEGRPATEW